MAIGRGCVVVAALAVLAVGTANAQQKAYPPGDVADGKQLFGDNCAYCHGPDGDAVPGADLKHGHFKRASTDDELVALIQAGIPGTAMPPGYLMDFETHTVVAYLRYLSSRARSASAPGDPVRG